MAGLGKGFAATNNVNEATLTGEGKPEQIHLAMVTDNFFTVLGVAPEVGQGLTPEDGQPLPPPAERDPEAVPPPNVLILSHDFWQRRFGGDREVVGRSVWIGGQPMQAVGVLPESYELLMPADAGMPTNIDAYSALRLDLAACIPPALKAARVDPMESLRLE